MKIENDQEYEEDVPSDNGSKYIFFPILLELLLTGILFMKGWDIGIHFLYALIPLLLGTSFIGTYLYNRDGDMKIFSSFAILTSIGTALQIVIDEQYHPSSTYSLVKLIIGIGIAILAIAMYKLFRKILNQSLTCYLLIGLSAAIYLVLIFKGYDPNGYGTSAWLKIGPMTIQLTDFTKLIAIMFYAALFSSEISRSDTQILIISSIFFFVNLVGSVCIKELGSFFILLFLHLSILYIFMRKGKVKRTYLLIIFFSIFGAVAITFLLYRLILPAHDAGTMNGLQAALWPILNKVHQRFSVTANIYADPYGAGYQLLQGRKALRMAGLFGNTVNFTAIPVAESDMAFVALVNSFGWIFGIFTIYHIFRIMQHGCELSHKLVKSNLQDAIVVYGATFLIFLQAMIVILGSCNIIPFTGLPIPFLSRGGTYMAIIFSFAGILMHLSEYNGEKVVEEEYYDAEQE